MSLSFHVSLSLCVVVCVVCVCRVYCVLDCARCGWAVRVVVVVAVDVGCVCVPFFLSGAETLRDD